MKTAEFTKLLQTVAHAWNNGNALTASECFSNDAVYIEPPDKQLFIGKDQLYKYFGGDNDQSNHMKMIWHNSMFNEETQTGAGEYTFEMDNQNHGVAVIEIKNEKIAVWREYQWSGSMSYDKFLDTSKKFKFSIKDVS